MRSAIDGVEVLVGHGTDAVEGRLRGALTLAVTRFLQRSFDEALERGLRVGFNDWLEVPAYTSEAREAWGRWILARGPALSVVHFLTPNRMLRMGISVVNLVFPSTRFVAYEATASYESARALYFPRSPFPLGS